MNLFFSNPQEGPQTHAFVIGIGDYPYLRNGALYEGQVNAVDFGLGQLTSSKVSARFFAEWLRSNLRNPDAPLGSIDLVLSDGAGAGSLSTIQQSFGDWYGRCDENPDNVALFYFCGHGIYKKAKDLLLTENFGESHLRVYENAIDFTNSWYGMLRCRAKTQVYLLDCCRETPFQALRSTGAPSVLIDWDEKVSRELDGPVLHSAAIGHKAFGPRGEVSIFTQSLVRCLEAFGAERREGDSWKISTASLAAAMSRAINRLRLDEKRPTFTSGGESNFSTDIHSIDRPLVLTTVSCRPAAALSTGRLTVKGKKTYAREPAAEPWHLEVEPGSYDLEARFGKTEHRDAAVHGVDINPPYYSWTPDVW